MSPTPAARRPEEGARLYTGPVFWTAEPGARDRRAALVDGAGRLVRLYDEVPKSPPKGARVIHLPGALALPGLHDAHLHLAWIGRSLERVDLRGATSPEEVRERVASFGSARPELETIFGGGWDQTLFPGGASPSAAALAGFGRPVVLERVGGHALWLNDRALALVAAGLPGGVPRGGASGLIVEPSASLRAFWGAAASRGDIERWLRRGLDACADAGLVAVHAMATSVAELEVLAQIHARDGQLAVRVGVYLEANERSWRWLEAHGPAPVELASGLRVLGVKLFADGALGSRGAALKRPYLDAPGWSGELSSRDALVSAARRARELGCQLAIHAIGDRGVALALAVIAEPGAARARAGRPRIEHAQIVDPSDWGRFVELGAVASMQPSHAVSDMRWLEGRLGAERLGGAYAWRSVVERGIPLAFGSDAPVESPRPTRGIYAALTRQDAAGRPEGGWRPEERLGLREVIAAYTRGAAFAAREERARGRLAPGYPFDVSVFDIDPRDAPRRWLEASALATVLGGRLRSSAR